MKNFIQFFKDLDKELKRTSIFVFLTYFLVLFSYPFVRSATGAIFYDVYTSAQYSLATFIGVMALIVIIGINNKLQASIGVHKLYFATGIFSIITLLISFVGYKAGINWMAYALFATKEVYIVLLVHSCLAFANALYNLTDFKRLIGPLGAAGSLGGILGGQLTSVLAKNYGTDVVFYVSLVVILLTILSFYATRYTKIKGLEANNPVTPIKAISGIKKYVFLIGAVVALSQFVIYIADLQFNMVFEKVVTTKDARTAYFGEFYSYINGLSLILQFVVLPFLLVKVSTRSLFLFVPLLYLTLVFGGLSFGVGSLFVIGSVFVTMKGIDYSIFAAAKDVMFHPLQNLQKFGAKYITDMFVYRASKAAIAFGFAQFVNIEMNLLSQLQFLFLSLWVVAIVLLFKEQKNIKSLMK
jgi:AAA family ATP:ADP antiporter